MLASHKSKLSKQSCIIIHATAFYITQLQQTSHQTHLLVAPLLSESHYPFRRKFVNFYLTIAPIHHWHRGPHVHWVRRDAK